MEQEGKKTLKTYYSIGEVADMFNVNTSLIRFWEKEFDIIKPHKNKKGNRMFTQDDINNFHLIYHLVKEKGMTLKGAQLKLKEKGRHHRVLEGVPASLPALVKAYRIQDKARGAGFDWERREEVWGKVREELEEFEAEVHKADADSMEEEFGDFLFSVINAARLYGVNPENALEKTNRKFIRRFGYIEEKAQELGKDLKDMSLEEMEAYWQEAKQDEGRGE